MPKIALVTGASAGIGEQTAIALYQAGFVVYAVARRAGRMTPLAERGINVLTMDLTDDASMRSAVETIRGEQGRLDVLVNNAGYGLLGAVEEVPMDEVRRQFDVNVFGLGRLVQLALPLMRAQRSGTIVNVSSVSGRMAQPLYGWYNAAKYAVEGLSDALRLELAPFGIKVILIEPGPIATEWNTLARSRLISRTHDGAYVPQIDSVTSLMTRIDRPGRSSSPQVVAKVIVQALFAPQPRTRYPAGRGAGLLLRARRLLPDRVMDTLIRRTYHGGHGMPKAGD